MKNFELIDSVLRGNERDFERLIRMYESGIFRVVIGLLHNKEDAEEVMQDIFLKLYSSLSSFDRRAAFTTWLYRIAINTSLNFLRRKRNKVFWTELKTIFQFSSKEPSTEAKMMERSKHEIIKYAINGLPKNQRLAFVLTKYEELSQKKVAEIMNTSEGAVEQLVLRAKNNLRKKLSAAVGFETVQLSNKKMRADEKSKRF
jgi:RNA polymerase sigma-70 factor (ECF subfamily)